MNSNDVATPCSVLVHVVLPTRKASPSLLKDFPHLALHLSGQVKIYFHQAPLVLFTGHLGVPWAYVLHHSPVTS